MRKVRIPCVDVLTPYGKNRPAPRLLNTFCILLLAALTLSSCGTSRKSGRLSGSKHRKAPATEQTVHSQTELLLDFAMGYLGTRYRYGGNSPREGFDCSGFACFVFNEFGIQLPRISADMSKTGRYVGKNELQKGDLVFFATGPTRRINHVGIITETSPRVLMIHSSTSAGIRIDDINSEYYRKRYVTSRRVDLDQ